MTSFDWKWILTLTVVLSPFIALLLKYCIARCSCRSEEESDEEDLLSDDDSVFSLWGIDLRAHRGRAGPPPDFDEALRESKPISYIQVEDNPPTYDQCMKAYIEQLRIAHAARVAQIESNAKANVTGIKNAKLNSQVEVKDTESFQKDMVVPVKEVLSKNPESKSSQTDLNKHLSSTWSQQRSSETPPQYQDLNATKSVSSPHHIGSKEGASTSFLAEYLVLREKEDQATLQTMENTPSVFNNHL